MLPPPFIGACFRSPSLKLDELAFKQHNPKMFLVQLPQTRNIERGIRVEAFYFAA
jgi:hypothetical protein